MVANFSKHSYEQYKQKKISKKFTKNSVATSALKIKEHFTLLFSENLAKTINAFVALAPADKRT